MIAAGVIVGLYVLCAVILVLGVKEKRGEAGMLGSCGNAAVPSSPGAWLSISGREGLVELSSGSGEVLQEARAPLGSVR